MTAAGTVSYTLSVGKIGSGTVSSSDGAISCGSVCSASYPGSSAVTLSATPASGYTFSGWSGACYGIASSICTVTVTNNVSVGATFAVMPATYALSVSKSPNGGTITSSDGFINCGAMCSSAYSANTNITLSASASSGYVHAGWSVSGATVVSGCSPSAASSCTVSMAANGSVTAYFSPVATTYTLTVTKTTLYASSGTISSSPGGISCGSACSASFASGTSITLTATPDVGSTFLGWSSCPFYSGNTCIVSLTSSQTIGAAFAK